MNGTNEHNQKNELDELLSAETPGDRERLQTVWAEAGFGSRAPFPDPARIDAVWRSIESELNRRGKYVARSPVMSARRFRRGALLLAAAAVIVGSVALGLFLRSRTYAAPAGARLSVLLPDGSSVELNNGSTLTFRRSLSGDRLAKLDGEAFFDVASSGDLFEVNTFNGTIDVLGTRFNVKAWPGGAENATFVSLESGSVKLAHRDHPLAAVVLSPGETRSIVGSRAQPTPSVPDAATAALAWRNGDLIFRDARLATALEDVGHRFAVDIKLSAGTFADRRINVAFRAPGDPEAVVNDLAEAMGLSYRPTSTGFELYLNAQ